MYTMIKTLAVLPMLAPEVVMVNYCTNGDIMEKFRKIAAIAAEHDCNPTDFYHVFDKYNPLTQDHTIHRIYTTRDGSKQVRILLTLDNSHLN